MFAHQRGVSLETLPKDMSHRIALIHPSESRKSSTTQIATRWIAHRMAATTEAVSRSHYYSLFQYLSGQSKLRTAAGWFFEQYANKWFRRGGNFEVDELPLKSTTSKMNFLTKPQIDINYFANPGELASHVRKGLGAHGIDANQFDKHFQPYSDCQESYDGVVFKTNEEVILLQYTMAKGHSIKPHGVEEFVKAMPKTIKTIHIVFVVPEGRARDYANAQQIPDPTTLGRGGRIKQWRLLFSDSQIKHVVLGEGEENGRSGTVGRHDIGPEGSAPRASTLGKRAREGSSGGEEGTAAEERAGGERGVGGEERSDEEREPKGSSRPKRALKGAGKEHLGG